MTDNEPDHTPSDRRGERAAERSHRRTAARQKAQQARARQKARARRGRWAVVGGIAVVVVALGIAVSLFVVDSVRQPVGPAPRNMASDGIVLGAKFKPVLSSAGTAGDEPVAPRSTASGDTVTITVYYDYLCPECGDFVKADGDYIRGLVDSGAARIELHPLSLLTNQSLGSRYSQRAANAAACVADTSPAAFFDFTEAMFARQPDEQTEGLTNAQIISIIRGVDGIRNAGKIASCVNHETFAEWVTASSRRAVTGPLLGTDVQKVDQAPLVLVNGQQYQYSTPFATEQFSSFVVTAAGNSYSSTATPTPTPTPTPTSTSTSTPKPSRTSTSTPEPTSSATPSK